MKYIHRHQTFWNMMCALSITLLIVSCVSPSTLDQAIKDDLQRRYPVGESRQQVRAFNGKAAESNVVLPMTGASKEYVQAIIKTLNDAEITSRLATFDLYRIRWSTNGSSLSARLYEDYVFFDANECVVFSSRRFLD